MEVVAIWDDLRVTDHGWFKVEEVTKCVGLEFTEVGRDIRNTAKVMKLGDVAYLSGATLLEEEL